MAFYMLGACRRNAAFMYIGVASKAASALGLHVTDQYRHFSTQVQSVRYLFVFDLGAVSLTDAVIKKVTYTEEFTHSRRSG